MREKRCPYCERFLTLNPRVRKRRKTCGRLSCQKALNKESGARWRKKNPGCHRGDYPRVRAWLDRNPGYLKRYRETHPEYVEKNREAKRLKYRQKKLPVDIRNKIKRQPPEIINQLWDLSHVDIQNASGLQPLEITYLLTTLPCLDIQNSIDKSPCLKDNDLIEAGRGGP
jgi:hypothetical protein